MRFRVGREALGEAVAWVARALPSRPVVPVLSGLLLQADDDGLTLSCFDYEVSARTRLEADVKEPGAALVSLPVAEYPALPEAPPAAGTVDGSVLAVAAAQVVPAASKDDTLPMLTAVCLDIDGETLTLAATDRYRLAVRDVRWEPAKAGLRAAAMVPARTLADVARTMGAGVPVTVAFGVDDAGTGAAAESGPAREPRPADGMISFQGGDRQLTAR